MATMVRSNLRCFQSNAQAFSIRNIDGVTLNPMLKASRRMPVSTKLLHWTSQPTGHNGQEQSQVLPEQCTGI